MAKELKLELSTESNSQDNNNHEFIYALQEAIKQIENGYSSGDLRNEDIESGYWEITEKIITIK